MKDLYGNIRNNKIFDRMMPTFGNTGELFWDFVVARMQAYMTHLMIEGWTPQWFDPDNGTVILLDHIARMFGCQQGRSLGGFPSIDASWSTQCPLNSNAPFKESIPRNAFTNMYRCFHFAMTYLKRTRSGATSSLTSMCCLRRQSIAKSLVRSWTQSTGNGKSV
jgi:hypothetical protein